MFCLVCFVTLLLNFGLVSQQFLSQYNHITWIANTLAVTINNSTKNSFANWRRSNNKLLRYENLFSWLLKVLPILCTDCAFVKQLQGMVDAIINYTCLIAPSCLHQADKKKFHQQMLQLMQIKLCRAILSKLVIEFERQNYLACILFYFIY